MPYELSFTKEGAIHDREGYYNVCCIGGDVVVDRLLPLVTGRYSHIQSNQEDWGWFVWFRKGDVRLAIDICTDDPDEGAFRIHLTSRRKHWFFREVVLDTPELEELRELVAADLLAWTGHPSEVSHVDKNFM